LKQHLVRIISSTNFNAHFNIKHKKKITFGYFRGGEKKEKLLDEFIVLCYSMPGEKQSYFEGARNRICTELQ